MLHPRDMISNLDVWNGLTNKMYKHQKETESRHITSMVVKCHGLMNAKTFETIKMNIIGKCIYVNKYNYDDCGIIKDHNAKFLSYFMSDFYKEGLHMEFFVHEIYKHDHKVDIKIKCYSSKYNVDDKKIEEAIKNKWLDVINK